MHYYAETHGMYGNTIGYFYRQGTRYWVVFQGRTLPGGKRASQALSLCERLEEVCATKLSS